VNKARLAQLNAADMTGVIQRVVATEVDEMWSSVGKKKAPRWLWHAIDHYSSAVLAYVFGRRKDAVLQELKQLLRPFGIERFTPITGARIRGNWKQRNTFLANGKPRRSNASISRSVHGSNGWRGKRFASPDPCRCMT
jgi:IS1 family transposase